MNNFKDYGFEADFEGEICFQSESYYVGYIVDDGKKLPRYWNKNLTCFNPLTTNFECAEFTNSNHKYNLKPIKKEWYENHENIGKILKAENTSTKLNELCVFLRLNKDKTITVLGLDGNKFIGFINDFRLATKEEILALLVKA